MSNQVSVSRNILGELLPNLAAKQPLTSGTLAQVEGELLGQKTHKQRRHSQVNAGGKPQTGAGGNKGRKKTKKRKSEAAVNNNKGDKASPEIKKRSPAKKGENQRERRVSGNPLKGKKSNNPSGAPSTCLRCKSPISPTTPPTNPSPRPRDSPSRYDFRKLAPSPPLLSEMADKDGLLFQNPSEEIKNLTMAPFAFSPTVKQGPEKDVSSPLVGGNLTNAATDVKAPNTNELSPPSSSSTLSSTNINQLISEVNDSGSKSEVDGEKPFTTFTHHDPQFAPVDVTKNGRYVFCVSQANNRVEVFNHFGKSAGKLRVFDRKLFEKPRNILHIPQCNAMKDEGPVSPLLNAGCVVVLDDQAFHVFSENGKHLGAILDGSKFRGLSYHRQLVGQEEHLYLVTVDVSQSDSVHLALIDLRDALKNSPSPQIERIQVAGCPDEVLKCRFVATMCDVEGYPMADHLHYAFVSAMKAGKVFQVDLETKVVKEMEFHQPRPDKEATFVDNDQSAVIPYQVIEPTGLIVVKQGHLVVADRSTDAVMEFSIKDGSLVKPLKVDGKTNFNGPIGLHYDAKDNQIYVSCNKTQTVVIVELKD